MSCTSCTKKRSQPGRQSVMMRSVHSSNMSSDDTLYGPPKVSPREASGGYPNQYGKMAFQPFACVSSMPCNRGYMNTQLGDGHTIGYYLMRNRILSNPTNQPPFYDNYDPTVMWTTPNDYISR